MSRGRKSDAKPGAIDVFVVDCDQSTLMVESRDMITIHPVLQYYDVIARDMPLIWCDYEKNWWITSELVDQQSQHVHWNRVEIHRFSSNCEVDHNFGAILTIGLKLLRSRRSPPDCGSLA